MQLAVATLDAERGTVFLHDAERGELYSRIALGSEIAEIRIPNTSGIAGAVFASDRAAIVDDAYGDPRFNPAIDERTGFRTWAVVCVPLRGSAGAAIGAVEILNKHHGRFDRADLRLLQAIADQAAVALEHAVLYESERHERSQDLKLRDASEVIAVDLDLDRLLAKIVGAAAQLLDAERATCFIHDAASDELWSRATAGGQVDEIRFAAGLGIAGASFTTAQPVNVADAYGDPRFSPATDAVTGFRTRNLLAVPLLGENDRPTGVLEVLNKRLGPFIASDERRLRSFATQASGGDPERHAVPGRAGAQNLHREHHQVAAGRRRDARPPSQHPPDQRGRAPHPANSRRGDTDRAGRGGVGRGQSVAGGIARLCRRDRRHR